MNRPYLITNHQNCNGFRNDLTVRKLIPGLMPLQSALRFGVSVTVLRTALMPAASME